jgi:hypothetical protein
MLPSAYDRPVGKRGSAVLGALLFLWLLLGGLGVTAAGGSRKLLGVMRVCFLVIVAAGAAEKEQNRLSVFGHKKSRLRIPKHGQRPFFAASLEFFVVRVTSNEHDHGVYGWIQASKSRI